MSVLAQNRKALAKRLGPELLGDRFRYDGKDSFVRVRDGFIDVLALQWAGSGCGFYLHYHVHLLSNPFEDGLSGYAVGARIDRDPLTEKSWYFDSEAERLTCFDSLLATIRSVAFSFFDSVSGPRDYLVEVVSDLNHRARPFRLDLIVALAEIGKNFKVFHLCGEYGNAIQSGSFDCRENKDRILDLLRELRQAAETSKLGLLLETWAQRRKSILEKFL